MIKDFRKFVLRGNVVDLAVAVVVGSAFNTIVQSFVKDLITPLVAAIDGKPNFANLYITLHHSRLMYGDFVNNIVSFLIIATTVFFFVVQPLNKLMAKLNPKDEVEGPAERQCPECLSAVPAEATRCKFCTTKLTPVKTKKTDAAAA
jgi:large conductance mechanosensitive channel